MPIIRPPSERLGNLPQAWTPPLKDDPVEGFSKAGTNAEAYMACLKHMISDIRAKRRFKTRIKLINGHLVDFHENTYRFSLDEDETFFEGARVEVFIEKQMIIGSIVSVSTAVPRFVLLSLDKNVGEVIEECELQQDDASFYEALLARYEVETDTEQHKSVKKVEADFKFADRVLVNDGQKLKHSIAINPGDLNSDQHSFLKKALDYDISYLWGPPGTGKTKCLGALISGFYKEKERSAIVSNTNQAVDQVLLKLCRDLVANGRTKDLEDGRIIRLGTVHHEELENEFGRFINLDFILQDKGQHLELKASKLRKELSQDKDLLEELEEVLGFIDDLDQLKKEAEYRQSNFGEASRALDRADQLYRRNLSRQKELRQEMRQVGSRGLLKEVFGKTSEQLDNELDDAKSKGVGLKSDMEAAKASYSEQKDRRDKSKAIVAKAEAAAKGKTRQSVASERKEANTRIKKTQSELGETTKKLENLKSEIVSEALVVGSTLTKVFLAPAQVGKYDNLIVDEASMAILPAIHFASSQAKKRIVVSGDFRQLPPIINSNNETIERTIGRNVFITSGVGRSLFEGAEIPNAGMLNWQYRMPDSLCKHVSDFAYNSHLRTAPGISREPLPAPQGMESSIVIIDTSKLQPFADLDVTGSRSNTIHAVIAKKLLETFASDEAFGSVGYCTPFRSQSNLVKAMVKADGITGNVAAGTIHVFQGDEKDTIILDTVEGLGSFRSVGMHISQDHPANAQLMTVASSRAKERMIIIANLKLLDQKLPAKAFLRTLLAAGEIDGTVIAAEELIPMRQIGKDVRADLLKRHEELKQIKAEFQAKNAGLKKLQANLDKMQKEATEDIAERRDEVARLENAIAEQIKEADQLAVISKEKQDDLNKRETEVAAREEALNDCLILADEFDGVFLQHIEEAADFILIHSAFITPRRVTELRHAFDKAAKRGVILKAVVPPPLKGQNGSIGPEQTKEAIQQLEDIGFVVDMRANIHEKLIIIDGRIVLAGSLNPLSFSNQNSEHMFMHYSPELCISIAKKTSPHGQRSIQVTSNLATKDNPTCSKCGGLTVFFQKGIDRRFECIDCKAAFYSSSSGSRTNKNTAARGVKTLSHGEAPQCEECGGKMIKHNRRDGGGSFWGCENFRSSGCKYTVNIE